MTINMDTALHVAVGTGRANHIVAYMIENMSSEEMTQKNNKGNSVLSIAAIVGNVEAAKMIMEKDVHLNLIEAANESEWIPLIEAARHGRKKMIECMLRFSGAYLMHVTARHFAENSGVFFVNLLIMAGFFGTVPAYHLQGLSHQRCLSLLLFLRGPFGDVQWRNDDGDEIVRKSGGIPLVIRILGTLLCQVDRSAGLSSINNCRDLLKEERYNIIAALELSYVLSYKNVLHIVPYFQRVIVLIVNI